MSILKFIVKKEKLKKNYSFKSTPFSNFPDEKAEELYLKELLIRELTKRNDSVSSKALNANLISDEIFVYPDKKVLSQTDILYILCSYQKRQLFNWDLSELGFNEKNKKYAYSVSVPLLNQSHTKAIVSYEYLCPGLCGSGETLLLTKRGTTWDIEIWEIWFH